ncbi:MAG: aspartate kinase, partial [Clostridia bacterium]|nr:aspartate kinase [Clostridia bacterium]
MLKVCKFGGTSMADAAAFRRVKEIIASDKSRRFIVVSAPGKRNKNDQKITDTLYECYRDLIKTGSFSERFAFIRERFSEIAEELKVSLDIKEILDRTEREIAEKKDADFTASRGEYLCARIMADFLGFPFVDAVEMVRFDSLGNLNADYTDDKVKNRLKGLDNAVIPGFYGKDFGGNVKTFSRG